MEKKEVIWTKILRLHLYEDLHMCLASHSTKAVYGDTVCRLKMMSGDFVGLDPSFATWNGTSVKMLRMLMHKNEIHF